MVKVALSHALQCAKTFAGTHEVWTHESARFNWANVGDETKCEWPQPDGLLFRSKKSQLSTSKSFLEQQPDVEDVILDIFTLSFVSRKGLAPEETQSELAVGRAVGNALTGAFNARETNLLG